MTAKPTCLKCRKPVEDFTYGSRRERGVRLFFESRCHGEVDRVEYYPPTVEDPPYFPTNAFPSERPPEEGDEASAPKTLFDLQDELEAMPEWQTLERIRTFRRSQRLFQRNAARLRAHLAFMTHDYRSLPLLSVDQRAAKRDAMEEVIFHLHDFVAAAMSLVDHSRVFTKKLYANEDSFPELKAETQQRFLDNPLIQFVHGLRQFSQHYRLPNIRAESRWTPADGLSRTLLLQKADLLEFSGWNAGAKKFFEASPEQFDIEAIVVKYEGKVLAFYDWVAQRQRDIHAGELATVRAKQEEIRAMFATDVPQIVRSSLDSLERGFRRISNVFSGVFGVEDWRHLAKLETSPVEWADAAIERTSTLYGALPEDVISRIRKAARELTLERDRPTLNLDED